MHLFLFINYIGGTLVIFVKGIFIINLKKLFGKKLIGIYGIFTQETYNSTDTSWYFQI